MRWLACVLVVAVFSVSCSLIGENELDDKPSQDQQSSAPSSGSTGAGASGTGGSAASSSSGDVGAGGSNACSATALAAAAACPAGCTSVGACSDATNTTCQLHRACGSADCKDMPMPDLVCAPSMDCKVVCEGHHGCEGDRVVCAAGRDCRVECSGEHACETMEIVPNGAVAVIVSCSGTGACKGMVVGCGTGDCRFECVGDACEDPPEQLVCPAAPCACGQPPASDGDGDDGD